MRLIDADEAIINFGFEWDDISPTRDEFVEFIKKQPTIEAEPVKCGLMRIETVDYGTHYRKYYFCPYCNIEIGHKTFDANRQFGQGTVLHSNKFPNYCPNCGAKLEERMSDNA